MTKRLTGRHVRVRRASQASRRLPMLLALLSLPLAGLFVVRGGEATAATPTLTNGCAVSARGIPSCGAYTGGAYGGNSDLAPWEGIARPLGVHRTFYRADQVSSAVKMAAADAAKKRVPWISFKVPHSWAEMAAGKGDAWARDLATRMSAVGGPVWLAFQHEPEQKSQSVKDWKAMQVRLSPIVRAAAPNVAYSVILMGYWQFYGTKPEYKMDAIWPNTKIDIAGFDIYEDYGQVKNGVTRTSWTSFKDGYFAKAKAWSASSGVPWGLAETGYSDLAAKARPRWIQDTYRLMVDSGGKAFSYFNTTLNNTMGCQWWLSTTAENADFAAANKTSARLG